MDKWIENKFRPRTWKFYYKEILHKKPRILTGRLKAKQMAIKTGTNTYNLVMTGRRYRKKNYYKKHINPFYYYR